MENQVLSQQTCQIVDEIAQQNGYIQASVDAAQVESKSKTFSMNCLHGTKQHFLEKAEVWKTAVSTQNIKENLLFSSTFFLFLIF